MNAVKVTSWQDNNYFIGFLNEYPDYQTQGMIKEELIENLKNLFIDIESGQIPHIRSVYSPLILEKEGAEEISPINPSLSHFSTKEDEDRSFDSDSYCLGELKKPDVIKLFEQMGCSPMYIGVQHDWYFNAKTNQSQPVPRHNEINKSLVKTILNKLANN
jgi:hypothetical protein